MILHIPNNSTGWHGIILKGGDFSETGAIQVTENYLMEFL